jgi:hypothetical protein
VAKNVLKLEDFFGAKRRAAILLSSQLLRSKGKERRMKLSVTMPMTNSDLSQCPAPFFAQFGVMEKQDSATNRATVDAEFDSMGVRIFSTDSIIEPTVSLSGALLHKFAMTGEGSGEKRLVSLDFLIYLPATPELRTWEWDHIHETFYLESVKAQGSLNLSDEAEEDDEERSNPLATETGRSKRVTVIPPANKKNGPKELAEFHAKQKPN